MESHHINAYLNQRMKNLALKRKNLASRARNYVSDEKVKYRPTDGVTGLDEKVQFNEERKENALKFNNQTRMYDAVKNYQEGNIVATNVSHEDTRTTSQKLNDLQYMKEAAYKYALDITKDTGMASEFMKYLSSKTLDYMLVFVQHYEMIKQKLAGTQILLPEQLIKFFETFVKKIGQSSYVDNPMTADSFAKEMKKYNAPNIAEIQELKTNIQALSSINTTQVRDLVNRINAIGNIVTKIDKSGADIQSTLPNREDINQLKDLVKNVQTSIEASDVLEKAEKIMQNVTQAETTRVMQAIQDSNKQVNDNLTHLADEIKQYVAPTSAELLQLRNKIQQLITTSNKDELEAKVDALRQVVEAMPSAITQTISNVPTKADVQSLLEAQNIVFKSGIKKILNNVNQAELTQLLNDSMGKVGSRIDALSEQMHDGNKQMNDRLTHLSDELKQYMAPTSSELEQLKNRIEQLITTSNKNELEAKVDALQQVVEAMPSAMTQTISNVPTKEDVVSLLEAQDRVFKSEINKILDNINQAALTQLLNDSMENIGKRIDTLSGQMQQYMAPTSSELEQLKNRIEQLITTSNKNELEAKVDALQQVVEAMPSAMTQTISNVPTKEDVVSLLEAQDRVFKTEINEVLAKVDQAALTQLLNDSMSKMNKRIDALNTQVQRYAAPTMASLQALHNKVERSDALNVALKEDLLQKIELLATAVNQLDEKTFQTVTNLPTKEDIEKLLQYEEIIEEEVEESGLKSVTPEETATLVEESKESKDIKIKSLKSVMVGDTFDIEKAKQRLAKNSTSLTEIKNRYHQFLLSSENPDYSNLAQEDYEFVMSNLGFIGKAKTIDTMKKQMTSNAVKNRMLELGIKHIPSQSAQTRSQAKEEEIMMKKLTERHGESGVMTSRR